MAIRSDNISEDRVRFQVSDIQLRDAMIHHQIAEIIISPKILSFFHSESGATSWRKMNSMTYCMYKRIPLKTKTRLQTDTTRPHSDWLTPSRSYPHWLKATSSQNQFENPPNKWNNFALGV